MLERRAREVMRDLFTDGVLALAVRLELVTGCLVLLLRGSVLFLRLLIKLVARLDRVVGLGLTHHVLQGGSG